MCINTLNYLTNKLTNSEMENNLTMSVFHGEVVAEVK